MTASTSVKWAVSSMVGAPTLNGTAGSLIAVLDAFLVNGFGTKAVDSAQVTEGVCRLAITGASAAVDHAVIQLAGVTGSGAVLNGLQRVDKATTSYVEFACDLPDGALTGTITFKIAPLGWEKVFSKTNVAVYRSPDPAGTRAFYRVDDTNALYAQVQMYEAMADVDSGVAAAPASPSGGFYWHKRQSASSSGVYWVLVGDTRLFYPLIAPSGTTSAASNAGIGVRGSFAGDINSYRSGDAWSAALGGAPSTTYSDLQGCVFSSDSNAGLVLQRLSHGLGASAVCTRFVTGLASAASGADASMGAFPSRADNGVRLSPIVLSDGVMGVGGPRGELPGVFHCPQAGVLAGYGAASVLKDGQGVFAGRKLLSIGIGALAGPASGCGFVDVTGPWRG